MKKLLPFLPAILLSLLSIKVTIFGTAIGDSIAVLGLVGLYSYKLYLDKLEVKDPNKELKEELEIVKKEITNVSMAMSQRKANTPTQTFRF